MRVMGLDFGSKTGDPTYITSYRNARGLIGRVERDELVEEMLKEYIEKNHWKR